MCGMPRQQVLEVLPGMPASAEEQLNSALASRHAARVNMSSRSTGFFFVQSSLKSSAIASGRAATHIWDEHSCRRRKYTKINKARETIGKRRLTT